MFSHRLYRETMEQLRAPRDKIEEVIDMTQHHNSKMHRRPIRTAAVAAAAIAMLSIGVSAAGPEGVQEFFYHISTIMKVDAFTTNISTQEGGQVTLLDLSQITVERRKDQVFLVAGEEELDITQALERDGRYEYQRMSGDTEVTAVVTGTPEEYILELSIAAGGEDGILYSYSTDFNGEAVHALEGDANAAITIYGSEDGESAQALP